MENVFPRVSLQVRDFAILHMYSAIDYDLPCDKEDISTPPATELVYAGRCSDVRAFFQKNLNFRFFTERVDAEAALTGLNARQPFPLPGSPDSSLSLILQLQCVLL